MNTALATVTPVILPGIPDDVERLSSPIHTCRGVRGGVRDPDGLPRGIVDMPIPPMPSPSRSLPARPEASGGLIVVLGAGVTGTGGKRAAMGAAAEGADVVVVTDDNPAVKTHADSSGPAGWGEAGETRPAARYRGSPDGVRCGSGQTIARGRVSSWPWSGKGHEVEGRGVPGSSNLRRPGRTARGAGRGGTVRAMIPRTLAESPQSRAGVWPGSVTRQPAHLSSMDRS